MEEKLSQIIKNSIRFIESNNSQLRENNITNQTHGRYFISKHNYSKTENDVIDIEDKNHFPDQTIIDGIFLESSQNAKLIKSSFGFQIKSSQGNTFENNSRDGSLPVVILYGKTQKRLNEYLNKKNNISENQQNEFANYLHIYLEYGKDNFNRNSDVTFTFLFPQSNEIEIENLLKQKKLIDILSEGFNDSKHTFNNNCVKSNEIEIINFFKEPLTSKEKFLGHYDI